MSNFRELRVWQMSMDFVVQIYTITQNFPTAETYGLSSQMRRAAVSIPSNVAEGQTREHLKEFLHHLSIAQASLAELQTQIEIASRLQYFQATKVAEILEQASAISRQLYALRNSLNKKLENQKSKN
jgi:four helix bundle protein